MLAFAPINIVQLIEEVKVYYFYITFGSRPLSQSGNQLFAVSVYDFKESMVSSVHRYEKNHDAVLNEVQGGSDEKIV